MDGTLANTKPITGDGVLELKKWTKFAEQFEDMFSMKCVVFPHSWACIDSDTISRYKDHTKRIA
jgi:hypothetical protein